MMDILKAITLGILEGITEFIPVSSTGHLIVAGEVLSFNTGNTATFDIAIQLGAILAVVFIYPSVFGTLIQPKYWFKKEGLRIAVAIFPALCAGFFLHSFIKAHLFTSHTVAIGLLVGGVIMLATDRWERRQPRAHTTELADISYKQASIIGLCQCAALWPGMSRSASTIVGGLFAGLSYELAAMFSFIIAVPVMLAAVSYDLLKSSSTLTGHDLQLIAIGLVVSFVVAYGSILTFLKLLKKLKLAPFAIYRIILASLVLAF